MDTVICPAFRQSIAKIITSMWGYFFRVIGKVEPKTLPLWDSPGELRVLVLAPHPDDELVGCGGTILRHKDAGDQVEILYISDGRKSRAQQLDGVEMALRRKKETGRVKEILRFSKTSWLGFKEGSWQTADLARILTERVNKSRPQIIYAPSQVDYHPEHKKVAFALQEALTSHRIMHLVTFIRIYQVHVPLTPILINLLTLLDSDTTALLETALAAYGTQTLSTKSTWRMRYYDRRYFGIDSPIEAFWQVSAAAFCAIHKIDKSLWPSGPFRGLRGRPTSDPLAYLAGASQRRQLARLIIGLN